MNIKNKDDTYQQSLRNHLMTIGFLEALRDNLDSKLAFKIACDGFTNYMNHYYNLLLKGITKGSQRRFDHFREHYENYALNCEYIHIVQSSTDILKVRYTRCPFVEIMTDFGLHDFSRAFCLSDYEFTRHTLPGVVFTRTQEIASGGGFCDHTWSYKKKKH